MFGMISIAGDIGGTKSWLVTVQTDANGESHLLYESRYQSLNFGNVNLLLQRFMKDSNIPKNGIDKMMLAVPGPVVDGSVMLTNLDWKISSTDLQREFSIKKTGLINDFQASALGTLSLEHNDIITLNDGATGDNGVRLVLGAGTGLGMAYLFTGKGLSTPVATEGGHINFSPTDDREIELLRYLQRRYPRVSYERILSGDGLAELFYFISGTTMDEFPVTAEWVNMSATEKKNPFAIEALQLFSKIYGQFVGNMVLLFRPGEGVYLTGGVTAKVSQWLDSTEFKDAYLDKGRMLHVVAQTPLYLVTNERVGVQGAISALKLDTML